MFYQVTGTLTSINAHITRNFYADSPEEAGKLATEEGIAVETVTRADPSFPRPLAVHYLSEEQKVSNRLRSVATVLFWLGVLLIVWSPFAVIVGIVNRVDGEMLFFSFIRYLIAGLLSLLATLILRALAILVKNSEKK